MRLWTGGMENGPLLQFHVQNLQYNEFVNLSVAAKKGMGEWIVRLVPRKWNFLEQICYYNPSV